MYNEWIFGPLPSGTNGPMKLPLSGGQYVWTVFPKFDSQDFSEILREGAIIMVKFDRAKFFRKILIFVKKPENVL